MDKNKISGKTIIIILTVVFLVGIIFFKGVLPPLQTKRYYKEEAQPLLEACLHVGENFGVTDFEYVGYDNTAKYSSVTLFFESNLFAGLTQEQMHSFFYELYAYDYNIRDHISYGHYDYGAGGMRIVSGDKTYKYFIDKDYFANKGGVLCVNNEDYFPLNRPEEKSSSSNKKKKTKCSLCNGTGSVKYYYGSSDIEAWLNGHEASWYGQCGSCNGTGYED